MKKPMRKLNQSVTKNITSPNIEEVLGRMSHNVVTAVRLGEGEREG